MSAAAEHLRDEGTRTQVVLSGAIAGLVSRFCIAPLDVLKIRLQLQAHSLADPLSAGLQQTPSGVIAVARDIFRHEGITGFWKGNIPAEGLYLSYGAVQFLAYRTTNQAIEKFAEDRNTKLPGPVKSFISGALAGTTATTVTYPLDLLRTRFAAQGTERVYDGLLASVREITRNEGYYGFFRGLSAGISQVVPNMGLFFALYEVFKTPLSTVSLPLGSGDALAGVTASVLSKSAVYPLDTVRKRLQVQGPSRTKYLGGGARIPVYDKGILNTAAQIARREGTAGLYRGLSVSLIKAAPASAVTMWTYERAIHFLMAAQSELPNDEVHLIRRAAARTLASQPSRSISTLRRSSARSSVFQSPQPIVYRAFHQSRVWRKDGDETSSEPVAQAIADEVVNEELKDEAIQAAEVAEAAAETAVNAGDAAPDVAGEASELAIGAAEVAEAAAEQARATAAEEITAAAAVTAASAASAAAATGSTGTSARQMYATPAESGTLIYVGNLFFEVNAAQLQAEFEKFGLIKNARIATDSRGLSRGFGYVEFENTDSIDRAIRESDQRVFHGRRMAVQMHRRAENPRMSQPRREQQTTRSPSKTLFIGNMSYQMSDKDLNDLFRNIKDVLDVRVAIDRRTGQPRGFAHADFVDEAAATRAAAELRDKMVYGRPLRIDYADHSRPPRTEQHEHSR